MPLCILLAFLFSVFSDSWFLFLGEKIALLKVLEAGIAWSWDCERLGRFLGDEILLFLGCEPPSARAFLRLFLEIRQVFRAFGIPSYGHI